MRNATTGQVCHTARTTFRPTATYSCKCMQATTWWEVVLALVKLYKSGREVHLHAWCGVLILPVNTLVLSSACMAINIGVFGLMTTIGLS